MDNRPIGVFDSGLGGLTAVKELMHQLPHENIVYFGDTGRVPYGTRSNETIIKYVFQDIRFLLNFDIKMIIIACGTASSVALQEVRQQFDIPIVGVVEPAVERAVQVSKNKRIGVIGTNGTINSGSYVRRIQQLDNSIKAYAKACPLFVPLVENGYIDNQVAELVAEEYLQPLKEYNVDTLIMGCTHYPLLKHIIAKVMGGNVELIDPGAETALYVKNLLKSSDALADAHLPAQRKYFVSDSIENFGKIGGLFLQKEIDDLVQKIDIEKY